MPGDKEWIRSLGGLFTVILTLLALIILVFAIFSSSSDFPPKNFTYQSIPSFADERLDFIGDLQDDQQAPRQWMLAGEDAATTTFGENSIKTWILIDQLPDELPEFSLFIDVGTTAGIRLEAYQFHGSGFERDPLQRLSADAALGIYEFKVPPMKPETAY